MEDLKSQGLSITPNVVINGGVDNPLINAAAAGEILYCSPANISNLVKTGKLIPEIVGGRGRGKPAWFRKSDVVALRVKLEEERGQDLGLAGSGILSRELKDAAKGNFLNLRDLTVMTIVSDPYRMDTVGGHRWGMWFRDMVNRFVPDPSKQVHIRGMHYRLIGQGIKTPDGKEYENNYDCWLLMDKASDYGRWLGYVDFDRIVDNRNDPPWIYVPEFSEPSADPRVNLGTPFADSVAVDRPHASLFINPERQPYRICMIGEKSSLRDVLQPIAEEIRGELLLPTGELSHTMISDLEWRAAADGRPLIVLYFSDFDPSGYGMPITVARKLQALRTIRHHEHLEIQVFPVCLAKAQVAEFGLPESPLKPGESRAEAWKAAMGYEQVEIDALCALRPELLEEIAQTWVRPFFDFSLGGRVQEAIDEYEERANAALESYPQLGAVNGIVAETAGTYNTVIEYYNRTLSDASAQLQGALDGISVPDIPEPEVEDDPPTEPLFTTNDDFVTATEKLIKYRRYAGAALEEGE